MFLLYINKLLGGGINGVWMLFIDICMNYWVGLEIF